MWHIKGYVMLTLTFGRNCCHYFRRKLQVLVIIFLLYIMDSVCFLTKWSEKKLEQTIRENVNLLSKTFYISTLKDSSSLQISFPIALYNNWYNATQ